MAQDNFPATLHTVLTGDATLIAALGKYQNAPAIFRLLAPEDINQTAFPYIVWNYTDDPAGDDDHFLKRIIGLDLDIWDFQQGSVSLERVLAVARQLERLLDEKRLPVTFPTATDADWGAMRSFLRSRTALAEPEEEPGTVHYVVQFMVIAWRQSFAGHLVP